MADQDPPESNDVMIQAWIDAVPKRKMVQEAVKHVPVRFTYPGGYRLQRGQQPVLAPR
jgi:hypothetical protein